MDLFKRYGVNDYTNKYTLLLQGRFLDVEKYLLNFVSNVNSIDLKEKKILSLKFI